jgi:hypothetical protein
MKKAGMKCYDSGIGAMSQCLWSALQALFLAGLVTACGGGGGGGDSDQQPPLPAGFELTVAAVRDLGAIEVNPAILQRDAGFSAFFQGQSVWLFGDTLLEFPGADNARMLSSSLSATQDIDAGDGLAGFSENVDAVGAPAAFFPMTEREQAFNASHGGEMCEDEQDCSAHWHHWPGTIVVDLDRDLAYVFYRKVLVKTGDFNFSHVGHSISVWKNISEPPERPVFDYVETYPTLFFSEADAAGFGSAAVVLGEDVYTYGCELVDDPFTKPCHVARVPLARILDRSAWSFYSGGDWSSDIAQSRPVFTGNDMMSVFFNSYLNRFVAIYSEPMAATAMLRTATRPEGPWSAPIELFSVDAPENPYGWVYDFLAHPEFSEEGGRVIYITYSKKADETHSELRLVAVELESHQ